MIGRSTQRVTIDVDLHIGPGVAVQLLHKGGNEARRVILWKEIIKGWGEQPSLLPIHWP